MRNSLAAIVLCISAAVAGAHSVTDGANKSAMDTPAAVVAQLASAPGSHPALTRTTNADAEAHDDLPIDDAPPVLRQGNPVTNTGEQRARGVTPAMLLAVMAVMAGMALRRYSTRMR